MKANVEVEDRKEGELIKAGLEDEPTRALVKIMGALSQLDGNRSRLRVINFVRDFYLERDERAASREPARLPDSAYNTAAGPTS
jgi:hypothetical protein